MPCVCSCLYVYVVFCAFEMYVNECHCMVHIMGLFTIGCKILNTARVPLIFIVKFLILLE